MNPIVILSPPLKCVCGRTLVWLQNYQTTVGGGRIVCNWCTRSSEMSYDAEQAKRSFQSKYNHSFEVSKDATT